MAAKLLASSNLSTPPDTYLYTLARAGSTLATIGSDDSLRLFALPDLKVTRTINTVNAGLSCLTTGSSSGTFLTGGRDAHIRVFDSRSPDPNPQLIPAESKGAGISALKCAGNFVAAGTESTKEGLGDVSVLVYDLRSPKTPLRTYAESHTDTITSLTWHPTQSNLLMSGSTDGLVSIFDADVAEEEDALMQVLNPRSAVHCSGFLTDDQVYSLSTDEQFSVYGLEKTGTAEEEALPMHQFGDLREKLECMYVIDLIQEPFLPAPVMAYGHNNNHTLSLTSLDLSNWNFGSKIELPGAHGEEVVRDVLFVDAQDVLTCGEDGCVKLWSMGEQPTGEAEAEGMASKDKKAKRKAKKEKDRFAPY